jgi:Cyclin-dependent kinase regulatory subunit
VISIIENRIPRAVAGLSTRVNCGPRDLSHVTSIYHHRNDRIIFHQWPPSKLRRPSSNNNSNKLSLQNRKQQRKQRRSKNTLQSKCCVLPSITARPEFCSFYSFNCFFSFSIHYSDRYTDEEYEYRHVILPKPLFKMIPKSYFNADDPGVLRLLSEAEWRGIGITQSLGWEHYEVHGMLSPLYPFFIIFLTVAQRLPQLLNLTCSFSAEQRMQTHFKLHSRLRRCTRNLKPRVL